MIRWAALVLASLSWVFAHHHYITPDPFVQWCLVGAAVLLAAIALRDDAERVVFAPWYLLLLVPVGICLLIALADGGPGLRTNHFNPWYEASLRLHSSPHRPGLIVLAVGILLVAGAARLRGLRFLAPAGYGAAATGALLVLQSPLYWLCIAWTARRPDMPLLGSLIYPIFKWLGSDVSVCNDVLYVRMMRDTHEFPLTWDHLALYPLLALWVGGVFWLALDRARRPLVRSVSIFSLVLAAYAVVRLVVLLAVFVAAMLFVEYEENVVHVEVFYLPWITAVSFLPLILILALRLRAPAAADAADAPANEAPAWSHRRRRVVALGLAAVSCFSIVAANGFWDPGEPKRGRVLLDEAHSQWERTDTPYDTDWYGHESGYNYYCMAQFLRKYYDLDINSTGPLTPEKLARYDVLILKTPTEMYDPAEVDAMDEFVRGGGGLFVMGEHTNVFGSTSCLNPVTRRFGLAYRYDVVFDIQRKWEQTLFPDRYLRHPAMRDVPFYRFAVSCSVQTDTWRSRPVLRGAGLWSLPIDYCPSNFYPTVEDHSYEKFGAFDQMLATSAGRGRVAAFADSTVYSNFLAFYPGKPELLLGTIDWLNRSNRWDFLNGAALAVGLAAGLAALLMLTGLPGDPRFAVSTIGVCAAVGWAGLWGFDRHMRRAYRPPEPHQPVHTIVFDIGHGDYELPVFSFPQKYFKSYEIFYQYVLRLDYYTTISFDLRRAARGDDPLLLIRPAGPFDEPTRRALDEFLHRGGSILVLDSPTNEKSTANELLRPYGLAFARGVRRGGLVFEPAAGARICLSYGAAGVEGGTPLLTTEAGETIAAVQRVGRGQIAAAGLADRFCDVRMGGGTRVIPDPDMRAAFELEFELMRGLVENDLNRAMRRLGETYRPAPTTAPAATTEPGPTG